MIIRIALAFLLCLFSSTYVSASDEGIKVSKNEFVYGGTKISKYSGQANTWNYRQIISELDQFKPFKTNFNSELPSGNICWIYFELLNPDSLDLWINFGSSRLDEIRIFQLDDNLNPIDSIESGFAIGTDYRLKGSYKFVMPILSHTEKKGKFLVSYFAHGGLQDTHICFGTVDQIAEESYTGNAYTLFFFGLYFILFFYSMILYFTLKDRIYLFYSINLVCIFFASTYAVNFPFINVLFGEELAQTYVGAWIWILPVTTGLFSVQYFELKKSAPIWYRVLQITVGLNILNAIGMLFLPLYVTSILIMIFLVLFYATCAFIGFDQLRKKHPIADLYVVSWVAVFIAIILYFMAIQLGLFYHEVAHYANYISASLEALLFSVALGKRYQLIMKKEKKMAQLLEKRNEMLVSANDSLDSFNYHVSHDLKTVLVNTVSLNLMMKKYAEKGQTEKVIAISDRLNNVAVKGQETVKGFLSLAEAGKIKEKTQEKIHLIQSIANLIEPNGLKNISITYDLVEFDTFYFNPTAFNSIFLNLLTNSNKYTLQKPEVHISFSIASDTIQIKYSDNGIGINLDENSDLLFSPFRRLDNTLNEEGSGIGLFLIRRIINEYNGTIKPFSELGKGLTFVITFPITLLNPPQRANDS